MKMTNTHERMTLGGDGWRPAIFAESRASRHICIIVYLYYYIWIKLLINQSCFFFSFVQCLLTSKSKINIVFTQYELCFFSLFKKTAGNYKFTFSLSIQEAWSISRRCGRGGNDGKRQRHSKNGNQVNDGVVLFRSCRKFFCLLAEKIHAKIL